MKEKDLVSIIIPTYKRSDRLANAIDSVLIQSYKNLEIIVIDDNNPNTQYRKSTEKIMSNYIDNPKIKYIKHSKNKNGAAARNTGINIAKGKFITFLDDDDLYMQDKILYQVNFLNQNNQYNAVYCGRRRNGKDIIPTKSGNLSKDILSLTFTPTTPALMFRAEVIKDLNGFDENFKRHQDFELLLRYFRNNKIGIVKEILVEIGQNDGENELHGDELEKNKKQFLSLFDEDINRIDSIENGFRKSVFISHYVQILCDYLSNRKLKKTMYIYREGIKISFFKFNIALLNYFKIYIEHQISKRRFL